LRIWDFGPWIAFVLEIDRRRLMEILNYKSKITNKSQSPKFQIQNEYMMLRKNFLQIEVAPWF